MDNAIEKPHLAHSHDVKMDSEYTQWLVELKNRYRSAQIKAAVKVNAEKLLFNWQLGRDLVLKKAEERWGSGVVEQVSLDLKEAFPLESGFSASNLWHMKKWYLFYAKESQLRKLHQLGRELQDIEIQHPGKLYQLGREIIEQETTDTVSVPMPPAFAYVPWRHHVEIIYKSKNIDEALFYICQTITNTWSRDQLLSAFRDNIYGTQGNALTTFEGNIPAINMQLAQELARENYNFSYISLHQQYSETDLEDALCNNITQFLLQLGNGFAFIGRQQEVVISGKDRKVDLLFYHIRLRCYVAMELKVKPFEPEFVSKLLYYTNGVNRFVKFPDDNPTIGILICTEFNQTDAELSFEGINAPLALATYNGIRIADYIPSEEILRQRVRQLEQELRLSRKLIHRMTAENESSITTEEESRDQVR